MKKEYRLIWFQHFHKAAGTSIINLAELNNERFWPYHKNANPTDSKGNLIELWKYSEDKLGACPRIGVVAREVHFESDFLSI